METLFIYDEYLKFDFNNKRFGENSKLIKKCKLYDFYWYNNGIWRENNKCVDGELWTIEMKYLTHIIDFNLEHPFYFQRIKVNQHNGCWVYIFPPKEPYS